MSVKLFYDPDRVEEFRVRGINPRRVPAPTAADRPIVMERSTVAARPAPTARPLAYVEENAQLRAEVTRLRADNQRLAAEVARLSGTARRPDPPSTALREDDAAARFALLDR